MAKPTFTKDQRDQALKIVSLYETLYVAASAARIHGYRDMEENINGRITDLSSLVGMDLYQARVIAGFGG